MTHKYAHFSPENFDNFDCLKVSKIVYALILFLLKGYLVWIMSVTNFKDRTGVITWIYPEPSLFYLSLLSGAGGLFVLLLLSLRRPGASIWVKSSWKHLRLILLSSLLFDFMINLVGYFYWQMQSPAWLVLNACIVLAFSLLLFNSQKIAINIDEFPEKLPEIKKRKHKVKL